jgi:hypothetical protein
MKFSSESHARQGWRGAISKLAAAGLAASALTLIAISPSQAASPLELGAADHFAIFGNFPLLVIFRFWHFKSDWRLPFW